MSMNILITGGCGYVGTILTKTLLDIGHKVHVYDIMWFGNFLPEHPGLTFTQGDIREIEKVPMAGMDAVIHLANVANDPCSDLNSKLNWEVNVLATKLLVEKAIDYSVAQFIYASSGSVYGYKEEPQVTEELSLVPLSDYNKTKMISERVLLSYADEILIQIVRPATVCGYSPRMRLDLSVNILTSQAYQNQKITVFGGSQTRPNIHIQDMVGVYLHFLKQGDSIHGIFNAGFENLSIMEIAQRASSKIKSEILVSESNDPRSYRLNSDKLLATGFKQKFTVDDAMDELIEAFQNGRLKDEDKYYNIRTMKELPDLF
jgi:nucleoside-diphosphate-sugar epimerase